MPEIPVVDSPASPDAADHLAQFAAEVARFREVLAAGRSAVFVQLFDFLVSRSTDDRAPKEVEIALAVFGKDGAEGSVGDSAVRVYVHRLRKRLDDHYANQSGRRLFIPKGQYRILLAPEAGAAAEPDATKTAPAGPRWRSAAFALAALAFVVLNLVAWQIVTAQKRVADPALQLRSTSFWRPLALDKPSILVTGDNFLLAEAKDRKSVNRLILDPTIRSRGDFGNYLTTHPQSFYTLYDFDLHLSPVGTALATWDILPVVNALHGQVGSSPTITPISRLKSSALDGNDIIYVGRLASMGFLAAPLFRSSTLSWDPQSGKLADRRSGRSFSDAPAGPADQGTGRDYGYIASVATSSGRHIVVISGLGDHGVQSMASLVTDAVQMGKLAGQRAATRSFEALYQVRTMNDAPMDRSLIMIRPLRSVSGMAANTPSAS